MVCVQAYTDACGAHGCRLQVPHIDMVGGMLHGDQGLHTTQDAMPVEFSPDLLLRHSSSLR